MTQQHGTQAEKDAPREAQPEALAAHLSSLLNEVDATAPAGEASETRLIKARLGIGSSLFTALRCKHAATAAHSLRVAMGCSSWAMKIGIESPELDEIEIAALLHDIGKIGVPDQVLLKPGKLSPTEAQMMSGCPQMSLAILQSCFDSPGLLDIVRYCGTWYRSPDAPGLAGTELPLGARMVAIVNAFDSMTNDQIYRRAMVREQAISELQKHSGTQFDPQLVQQFCELHRDLKQIDVEVAGRWLQSLEAMPTGETADWPSSSMVSPVDQALMALVHQRLLDNMRDAVIFVAKDLRIQLWNRGPERLTGIRGSDVFQRQFRPSLIELRSESGSTINRNACPVVNVLKSSVQSLQRYELTHRNGERIIVDMQVVPVIGQSGETYGANLLLHDVSGEASLLEQCENLQEKAARDPLTQVANRAEFDRAHKAFVSAYHKRGVPCSLIVTDIDLFKKVNDQFGHQAGDEALKIFSNILTNNCRPGDLVARYGGEEFVILCADCDLDTANGRAEALRQTFADTPIPALEGRRITASFGVSEIEAHYTDETMFRRADRALLGAKEHGRNAVVALGSAKETTEEQFDKGWFSWWKPSNVPPVLNRTLVSPVPMQMAIAQLRGFIFEVQAEIKKLDDRCVVLRVDPLYSGFLRRESDRPVAFLIHISCFEEEVQHVDKDTKRCTKKERTRLEIIMRPRRSRDRRRDDVQARAAQLLVQLQSFLMASELPEFDEHAVVVKHPTDLGCTWVR